MAIESGAKWQTFVRSTSSVGPSMFRRRGAAREKIAHRAQIISARQSTIAAVCYFIDLVRMIALTRKPTAARASNNVWMGCWLLLGATRLE